MALIFMNLICILYASYMYCVYESTIRILFVSYMSATQDTNAFHALRIIYEAWCFLLCIRYICISIKIPIRYQYIRIFTDTINFNQIHKRYRYGERLLGYMGNGAQLPPEGSFLVRLLESRRRVAEAEKRRARQVAACVLR